MMLNQMSQAELLHWIDMVSFAVVDITLYLDSHSRDEEALEFFRKYSQLRREALKVYSEKYGPLTIDTANPDDFWAWAEQPWPWEGGCR